MTVPGSNQPISFFSLSVRGATALLVAACNRLQLAGCASCNSFQLTHMTTFGRLSRQYQWRPKGRQELSTALTTPQHGEFRHVSVRERQRSRLCGQNLCGAFVKLYWQPMSKRAIEQWRPTAQQKRSYLHHQGEFQHQNCMVVSLHDSDHDGVVRIFVRHPNHSNELFTLIIYLRRTIFPLPGV